MEVVSQSQGVFCKTKRIVKKRQQRQIEQCFKETVYAGNRIKRNFK